MVQAVNKNVFKGKLEPIADRVLVTDMYFGEQKTKGGIILTDDDGKTRGIYPRWAKVYKKGPRNKEPYEVGQWILVEHGMWTRGINLDDGNGEKLVRMVDPDAIVIYADEKPEGFSLGKEFNDMESFNIDPQNFENN